MHLRTLSATRTEGISVAFQNNTSFFLFSFLNGTMQRGREGSLLSRLFSTNRHTGKGHPSNGERRVSALGTNPSHSATSPTPCQLVRGKVRHKLSPVDGGSVSHPQIQIRKYRWTFALMLAASSLRSLSLGKASCHVARTLEQPAERN